MYLFIFIAAAMVIVHAVAAVRRPRLGVIAFGVLWLLYGIYEYKIITGVLCDANCNIRADLILIIPIMIAAVYSAYQSYEGRPRAAKVFTAVVGTIGLLVMTLFLEDFTYGYFAVPAVLVGALGFWLYRRKRSRPEAA